MAQPQAIRKKTNLIILYNYRLMENCIDKAPCILSRYTLINILFQIEILNIYNCVSKTPFRKFGCIFKTVNDKSRESEVLHFSWIFNEWPKIS